MITFAYSVFDKKVGAFVAPFFCRSNGEAIRSFIDACADEKHQFFRHAGDYELYCIASYDDETGSFERKSDMPTRLITALECVSKITEFDSPR